MLKLFLVEHAAWVIPLTLLLLQFLLKFFIAEAITGIRLWEAVLQAPVEIGFLALSFAAAVLLAKPDEATHVFGLFVVYLILLIISVALWKASPGGGIPRNIVKACILSSVNFAITLSMLVYSISLLTVIRLR